MNKKFSIATTLVISILVAGCGKIASTQNASTVEAGKETDLTKYISFEDGVTCVVKETNLDFKKPGKYKVTYMLTKDGKESDVTYSMEVVDTTAPEIKADDLIVFEKNELANLSQYVTCIDIVDGDLSGSIQYGTIDTSEPGEQIVTVYCADSSGNQAQNDITVIVKDNDPLYIAAQGAIDGIKDSLGSPESFELIRIYGKRVEDNYIFYCVFNNLNGFNLTTTNEIYIKVDSMNQPVYVESEYYENPKAFESTYYSGLEYLEADSEQVKLRNEFLGYNSDTEKDITEETDPPYKAAINAVAGIKNTLGSPATFKLRKVMCRESGDYYLFCIEAEHEGGFSQIVEDKLYVKVDARDYHVQNHTDGWYEGIFNSSYYFEEEYNNAIGEFEMDIERLKY